jgi:hypothetical protein
VAPSSGRHSKKAQTGLSRDSGFPGDDDVFTQGMEGKRHREPETPDLLPLSPRGAGGQGKADRAQYRPHGLGMSQALKEETESPETAWKGLQGRC